VADEIQTGFGRTGAMFAVEHSGVVPDLIAVAKSLAGGLPLSAVIGRADIMDAPEPGGLGGTFAGNLLACAAGLAVFDIFAEEPLLERAQQIGKRVLDAFCEYQQRIPQIGDVRGLGAMVAIELVHDPASKEPAPELAQRVIDEARRWGLLLLRAGLYANVVRVLVPLVATDQEIDKALLIFGAALEQAVAG
jgi:4-aminobutyrate aminotransferase/(S)-3-amino-2-methylpropionate transaminase